MKKFKELVNALYNKEFTVADKGRIQQKEQLDLKNDLTNALFEDTVAAGEVVLKQLNEGLEEIQKEIDNKSE